MPHAGGFLSGQRLLVGHFAFSLESMWFLIRELVVEISILHQAKNNLIVIIILIFIICRSLVKLRPRAAAKGHLCYTQLQESFSF